MSTKDCSSSVPDGKENANPATRTSQRKRVKTSDPAARSQTRAKSAIRQPKTGRLSQLMNMPMDVLMEVRAPFLRQIRCIYSSRHVNNAQIFGHLHPLDLLHLARTTKAFRRVLMHRSAISVWKTARATVPGLPDRPPEMSEPQWANLAFDPQCHVSDREQVLFPFTSWYLDSSATAQTSEMSIGCSELGSASNARNNSMLFLSSYRGRNLIHDALVSKTGLITLTMTTTMT
jgi:hypothetical protein